jgi:hypothetical protein
VQVDLISKAPLHAMLVGGASVFQAEWHGEAICAERGDERSRELVGILHCDLVIARVGI